eukprot:1198195-Amphidinium_carterae.1
MIPAITAAIATLTSGLKRLRLPLNAQKTLILHCSKSAGLAQRISQAYGFATAQYGKFLGCSLASGRRRRVWIQKARHQAGVRRLVRLGRLRKQLKFKAARFAR